MVQNTLCLFKDFSFKIVYKIPKCYKIVCDSFIHTFKLHYFMLLFLRYESYNHYK